MTVKRTPIHIRSVRCKAYSREDGLLDVEGTLVDEKPMEVQFSERGKIPAGEPIHEMSLRLTIDRRLHIVAAQAHVGHSPHRVCPDISASYGQLVGMRIGPGFNRKMKALFRGTAGCSHLTELIGPLATTAFQALASLYPEPGTGVMALVENTGISPFDGCHALKVDGDVVRTHYPLAYRGRAK